MGKGLEIKHTMGKALEIVGIRIIADTVSEGCFGGGAAALVWGHVPGILET